MGYVGCDGRGGGWDGEQRRDWGVGMWVGKPRLAVDVVFCLVVEILVAAEVAHARKLDTTARHLTDIRAGY
jgi:hypothetical protein